MSGNNVGLWKKRLSEGIVIVLSILAAFAIDAWWDSIQQQNRARAEVASLKSEFELADRELARASAELATALEATQQLARRAGPNAVLMPADSFGVLFTHCLTINAVELPSGALGNVLSSGDLPILRNLELQRNLASWPSIANLMSVKFRDLVVDRNQNVLPVVNRFIALSPMLSAGFPLAWADTNHFAFDSGELLGSREFENLMAERWIGIQIAAYTVADARKLARSIRDGLEEWP